MLKLKVKEKLLNRLNELDVTEVIDSNGNHIAVEDLIEWVNQMKPLITYDDNDGTITIDGIYTLSLWLENGLSSLYTSEGNPLIPSGKIPNLWETDDDFDGLSSDLLEQLQVGDIIYSSDSETTAIVDCILPTDIYIKELAYSGVNYFTYLKDGSDWNCTTETVSYGTHLYKHTITDTDGNKLIFISKLKTAYASVIAINQAYSSGDIINAILSDINEGQVISAYSVLGAGSSIRIHYYDVANAGWTFLDIVFSTATYTVNEY